MSIIDYDLLGRTVAHALRHEPWVYERVWLADRVPPRLLEEA